MSKVEDSFQVGVGYDDAVKIIRKIIMPYGGVEKENVFEVRTNMSMTESAVTIIMSLKNTGPSSTSIEFVARCFGFGPLIKKHCRSKIGEIQFAIFNAYSNMAAGSDKHITE